MTVSIARGNLLQQDVDAVVNTVNTVGVMGKGIALQFKNRWPENFRAYVAECKAGHVRPGRMFVFDSGGLVKPHFIINFPTKTDWRQGSKLSFIRDGLNDLIEQVRARGIRSIAIPPLGCGAGGLSWSDVRPMIEEAFDAAPEVEVRLFEPAGAPPAKEMEHRTARPKMTPSRAAILKVLETYKELDYGLSKIEVQKLAYFLQVAGQDLQLTFVKHQFGPYSDALRHALNRMEGHFIRGVGDGDSNAEIEPDEGAIREADALIASGSIASVEKRVSRVAALIDGFQSPYGMELLSSVHWVAARTDEAALNAEESYAEVRAWNQRKAGLMTKQHVAAAWQRLEMGGWLRHRANNT